MNIVQVDIKTMKAIWLNPAEIGPYPWFYVDRPLPAIGPNEVLDTWVFYDV